MHYNVLLNSYKCLLVSSNIPTRVPVVTTRRPGQLFCKAVEQVENGPRQYNHIINIQVGFDDLGRITDAYKRTYNHCLKTGNHAVLHPLFYNPLMYVQTNE